MAFTLPRYRLADDAGRGLELPQRLAGVGVDGHELASERAGEHEAAGGDEGAGKVRALERHRPFRLAGERIDCPQVTAAVRVIEDVDEWALDAVVRLARLESGHFCRGQWLIVPAEVHGVEVKELGLWAERHRVPVLAAGEMRPHLHGLAFESGFRDVAPHRTSGGEIDAIGPVHLDELVGFEELAGGALDDV